MKRKYLFKKRGIGIVCGCAVAISLVLMPVVANADTTGPQLMPAVIEKVDGNGNVIITRTEGESYEDEESVSCSEISDSAELTAEGKTKLPAPTGVTWDNWEATWNCVEESKGYYEYELWKDGKYYTGGYLHNWKAEAVNGVCAFKICDYINESGTYKFRIRSTSDYDENSLESSEWSEFSEEKVYVRPNQELGTTVGWWDTENPGIFCFNAVDNAEYYMVCLYYDDEITKERIFVIGLSSLGIFDMYEANFSNVIAEHGAHQYYVIITAYSHNNIDNIANGVEGGKSGNFDVSLIAGSVSTAISNALSGSGNNAEQAIAKLRDQVEISQLALAMQINDGVLNQMKELERLYANQNSVAVSKANVSQEANALMNSSRIDVVGAALNADSNSTIKLNVEVAKDKIDVASNNYAKSVQLDITLECNGNQIHELKMPVTITMPIPAGIPADKLTIVHYSEDGSYKAVSFKDNGDGTVTFTVTHFSNFIFGMTKDSVSDIPEGPSTWQSKSGVEGFVYRLYNIALSRDAEEAGLADWINRLNTKQENAAQVAYGFFFSDEFKDRNYTDEQYVELLYRTMFGRESDESGKTDWLFRLESGASREYVYHGFAESEEFSALCNSFGVERGTVTLNQYRDRNIQATGFIARLYTKMLGRKFDEDGLEDWCKKYLTKENTIEEIASHGFLHSQELANLNLSDEEFVTRMYETFLDREPEEEGLKDWIGRLRRGEETRDSIVYGFTNSPEFGNLKAEYNLP